jgi:MFS transporter, DHA1 family, multidrug resistance protein
LLINGYRLVTSGMVAYTTFVASFTSSIYSAGLSHIAPHFHVSEEVAVLGLSLYVLGFAFGPILWGPLSELSGRRLPLLIGVFGFSIFTIAVAVAKDLQTVMLCRFFAGLFASCPLAVVPGIFVDIFNNHTRGTAITIFAMCVFMGPEMAPFIGGFITQSYLDWRWTMYLTSIMGWAALVLNIFFLSETYAPIILVDKATELRRRTKNWAIHAKQEEIEIDFQELIITNFSRPLRLLFTEPIVLLISIYTSFVYGLLYLFLTAYPLVFEGVHGMNLGVGGLPYFGLLIGMMLAGVYIILLTPSYNRKLDANGGIAIPEWRLPQVIVGGVAFSGGLFWFGWSGYKESIHWIVPTLSGLLSGFGLLAIFLQLINYLIDAYTML